jgi:hypothetical protein
MGGAHRLMHSQRNAGLERPIQAVCEHSAMPLETPPPYAGNKFVSNRKAPQSANEAVKMQEIAS